MKEKESQSSATCAVHHMAVRDTMDILNGKWKIRIIASLSLGKKRFMELITNIDGIAAKMLSKELQEMEVNGLITRSVLNTKPITVEYALTDYGRTLKPVIDEMALWGVKHRKKIMKGIAKT